MGQAPVQQEPPRRLCRTQEISLGSQADGNWQSQTLSRWTTAEDTQVEDPSVAKACKAAILPACCRADEGPSTVEEVLVVHHDALRKVNFLLKVDELSGCDLPAVPECVLAARRADLQRRQNRMAKETVGFGHDRGPYPRILSLDSDSGSPTGSTLHDRGVVAACSAIAGSSSGSAGRYGGSAWMPPPGGADDFGAFAGLDSLDNESEGDWSRQSPTGFRSRASPRWDGPGNDAHLPLKESFDIDELSPDTYSELADLEPSRLSRDDGGNC